MTYDPVVVDSWQHQLTELGDVLLQLSHPVLMEVQSRRRTGLAILLPSEVLNDDTLASAQHSPSCVRYNLAQVPGDTAPH